MDRNNQTIQHGGRPVSGLEAANANEYFDLFLNATSLKHILGYYRGLIDHLHLKPNVITSFYPKLRANLTTWRSKALWKKFDSRASHKCYQKGKLAAGTRVLIIGGGPCGMRTAIEAQLLGAKVVVVEKRDRFSRNNVLHLWPFVIEDLRMLGAKKFFGKFCAGAIDHISIRQLQCILTKVALLLGVEVHTEVSFEKLIEPNATDKTGWRAECKPANHPVSLYEFDVIIGADGKRNTLQGFSRKEFRGKLAIAITANFINKKTEAEARVEEISGVAFIFNQKFFKDLLADTRIDLENIVYYKDDTHYFVMTAKKASLLEKGVIKQDLADTERLLAPDNVDREALQQYAIEAASFSTNYQMPNLEFAVNHYGQPDIAMFDFTSMYAAENASKVVERNGHRLLMILVGDSLLEPFWPTGSGCARGFLSALDAAWAIRSWSLSSYSPLDVLAERESIYRLLAQTTPDNLNKDWKSYTVDPSTRYPNLNKGVVLPHQVICLYDTDNPSSIDRMKRASDDKPGEVPKKKKRRGNVDDEILLSWLTEQLREDESITITDISSIFKGGRVLCAIIHHYRPDLLDYSAIKNDEPAENNQLAIDTLEKELGIPPIMTGVDITNTEDYLTMASYLTEVYDAFRGEIPHIKLPKLELPESVKMSEVSFKTIKTSSFQPQIVTQPSRPSSRHKRHGEVISQKPSSVDRKTRKRRTLERVGASVEERQKMLEEISSNRADRQNRRRYQRKLQTEQFLKSMQMLQANAKPGSQPFEDYSIFLYRQTAPKFEDRVKDLEKQFTYIPDHDNKTSGQTFRGGGKDEDLAARIKSLENKWRDPIPVDKKPKDLLRAIGKIETSDWNIKEIEKKILENKLGKPSKTFDKEKVPKWSKEQFLARQTKMEKQHLDRQDSVEAKYADIDKSIKNLDQKLKEGTVRELGTNKVATLTEKLTSKVPPDPKPVEKSVPRPPPVLPTQGSETCHFCGKRVYLMERLSAEGRFFHHGCFKCQYCYTQLRLGSYAFDRDGQYGFKFFCLHHFGMVGVAPIAKVTRKPSQRLAAEQRRSPEKKPLSGISGVDLLDKVHTPERIEFSNLSVGHISSDQDDSLSQMDEDEWTDKNFGASCAELDDSDSSSMSDTDSDDEDAFDDALEEPVTKEGTMKWAERWKNSYSKKRRNSNPHEFSSSDQSSYYENTSDEEESDTATEGEEEIRARELRKKEVCVEPPIVHTDTGTDTEVKSSFNLNCNFPDIISNHNRLSASDIHLNKSSDNVSADSADFNSAESGELDLNMNKKYCGDSNRNVVIGKLTIANGSDDNNSGSKPDDVKKTNRLTKSVTSGDMLIKRNFVVPPKENRRMFGAEFVSKFQSSEPEPLLVIKRTPSKLSLPKEVGKPKVAVNTSNLDKGKYFGVVSKKPPPRKTLARSETVSAAPKSVLVKQHSLPETTEEKKDLKTFNFEPEDSDLVEIDDYIENLLANEDELHKPIDPEKYKTPVDEPQDLEDENVSSSIEDLLKALETEAKEPGGVDNENVEEMPGEKIEDLLSWMEGLEHQTKDRKVYRSFSDVKYKNLEKVLKTPNVSDCVNKIPQNNLSFFELHLSGKGVPRENSDSEEDVSRARQFNLKRSKTEITFNKGSKVRKSVNLDDIEKVDIKKMLRRFETPSETLSELPSPKPAANLNVKRNSFTGFGSVRGAKDQKMEEILQKSFKSKPKPIKNTIQKFEKSSIAHQDLPFEKSAPVRNRKFENKLPASEKKPIDEYSFDDLDQFVQETLSSIGDKYERDVVDAAPVENSAGNNWNAQVTVSTILSFPEVANTESEEQTPIRSDASNVDLGEVVHKLAHEPYREDIRAYTTENNDNSRLESTDNLDSPVSTGSKATPQMRGTEECSWNGPSGTISTVNNRETLAQPTNNPTEATPSSVSVCGSPILFLNTNEADNALAKTLPGVEDSYRPFSDAVQSTYVSVVDEGSQHDYPSIPMASTGLGPEKSEEMKKTSCEDISGTDIPLNFSKAVEDSSDNPEDTSAEETSADETSEDETSSDDESENSETEESDSGGSLSDTAARTEENKLTTTPTGVAPETNLSVAPSAGDSSAKADEKSSTEHQDSQKPVLLEQHMPVKVCPFSVSSDEKLSIEQHIIRGPVSEQDKPLEAGKLQISEDNLIVTPNDEDSYARVVKNEPVGYRESCKGDIPLGEHPRTFEAHNAPEVMATTTVEDLYMIMGDKRALDHELSRNPVHSQRAGSGEACPPQRPLRQKSLERKASNLELPQEGNGDGMTPPCVPLRRKRSTAASPIPVRKMADDAGQSIAAAKKCEEPKKEVVTSFYVPKPQTLDSSSASSVSSGSHGKQKNKIKDEDKEKDCCIQ